MKKKAEDLKPGEILDFAGLRYVVLFRGPFAQQLGRCALFLGALGEDKVPPMWREFDPQREIEVESPTLTPAQQHAEELLAFVRQVADTDMAGWQFPKHARAIVARIDPPKPPSVEELAEALAYIFEMDMKYDSSQAPSVEKVRQVINRARAAGYLGKDAK